MLQQSVISILGIAFVVALAWWVFRKTERSPMREADAMRLAEDGLTGFDPIRAACGRDGRGALVAGGGGRIAVLKPHGDHVSTRILGAAAKARREEQILIVDTGETMFGTVRLDLGAEAAGEWQRMIEDLR